MSNLPAHTPTGPDPYRGVVHVLGAVSALGTFGTLVGGLALRNPVVLDAMVALLLTTGVLLGVARAQRMRAQPDGAADPAAEPRRWRGLLRHVWEPLGERGLLATVGGIAIAAVLSGRWLPTSLSPLEAALAAAFPLAAVVLAATAARYLAAVPPERLPEAPGLSQAFRVLAWIFLSAAAAIGLAWVGAKVAVRVLHAVVLLVDTVVCLELSLAGWPKTTPEPRFPSDLRVFSLLGSRANLPASVADFLQRRLGIDLRSTWALTVVRRSAEPLLAGLLAIAWLSTALTVVGIEEEGLVERLGVPVGGPPLAAGLHLHLPWPIDRVIRLPVRRVQTVTVGHEGEGAETGPEDVLWARQHGEAEYTLLLGNGRDLIAIDAAVQYRIADPRSWQYGSQRPVAALRAIAYRAVMTCTVDRTLTEALSENVAALTARMRAMVQADANALGLGIEILGFTLGGMHPPVMVARDYQAVVSAELGRTTAAIDAQAYRNEIVPSAEAKALVSTNTARADGAKAVGAATGEAWSFRTLTSEYDAAPQEFRFRRRLETLERVLDGATYTVMDARFQRDGGELWLTQ